jgi:putative ABC transport system permease protein
MLRNNFKIAWRHLLKSKLYSSINIIGLATGMAVAMLIGLWIRDELSFDTYHANHHRLAEIMGIETFNGQVTVEVNAAVPLADELHSRYPGDFKNLALTATNVHVLEAGDKKITQWGTWAQPAFPAMFSLRMVEGDQGGLKDPGSILLSQWLAKSLFGPNDPMGKLVRVDNKTDMRVAGIYEDLPQNTTLFGTDFLLAWDNKDNRGASDSAADDWYDHHFHLFVQLSDAADFDRTSTKIRDLTKPHLIRGAYEEIGLYPMDKWHLYNAFVNGKMAGGQIRFVWIFGMIGIAVLLLACINFMNLSTARSEQRAREVGIRKAIGSLRRQLIAQFLSESILMAGLAMAVALVFLIWLFPFFNQLAGKQMTIPRAEPWFWLLTFCFTLFTGVVAGSYPGFYLSGFQPVKVLKGAFRAGRWASLPRKFLVVVQFTVSITLIIGTIIVFRQIRYARDRPVGYTREGLITMSMTSPEIQGHYDALRSELLQTGVVEDMAESSSPSTEVQNSMLGYDWKGRDPQSVPIIGTLFVTYDFGRTIGWQMKEGRDFSRNYPTDSGAYILNEAAAAFTGLKHPVGESIHWHGQDHLIVGVVKDMVMESPYMPVQPTFFTLSANRRIHVISIRIKTDLRARAGMDGAAGGAAMAGTTAGTGMAAALAKIGSVFKKYDPASPFEYQFTDEAYGWKFLTEEHIGNLASFFAILAIFISCLGLFGLASFVAEQRTKEIGIRKVLGATVFNLWSLLSKEFVALVALSFLIATPIAGFCLDRWLQGYAYRVSVSWGVFAAAGAGALAIALLTVSFQAVKAALMNPVKSLKTE